jgi:UDP-2,3-diacylglucosamine hydrolase
MDEYIAISNPDVYFVADAHFRQSGSAEEAPRRQLFIRFLEGVPAGSGVMLLGDIFDYYFEHRAVIPKGYFDVCNALHECTKRNVDLHFIGGNHDYWVGDFFPAEIGIRVHPDDFLLDVQGRRICCSHGDNHIPGEPGYKVLRAIMRNRATIWVAKLLHPDLMDAIATRVSSGSKKRKRFTPQNTAERLADLAPAQFFNRGNDGFVMGHVHYPLHRSHDGRDFIVVGDWITHFTYARLTGGRLTLETYEGVKI